MGNSAFDGSMRSASTTSNRLMDINPEDIESMSVLKGPAAAAYTVHVQPTELFLSLPRKVKRAWLK